MNKKLVTGIAVAAVLLTIWVFSGGEGDIVSRIYVSPQQGEFHVTVATSGELRAQNSTMIMGPAGARDVGLYNFTIQDMVPEGTLVEPGDYVAELDRTQLETSLQSAELDLIGVEAQYEQALLDTSLQLSQARNGLEERLFQMEEREIEVEQSIYESPAVQRQAEIALDRARMAFDQDSASYEMRKLQAIAQLREIEADLASENSEVERIKGLDSLFTIRAPEEGMVVYYRTRNGQRRGIGSEFNAFDAVIAELPDFSNMESVTFVNEVDIQKVKQGQQVSIGLDANRNKRLTGTVTSVANIGEQRPNSDARVFEVIIQLNGSDPALRPTMTTSNEIQVATLGDVLYIPLETVYQVDENYYVYKQSGSGMVLQQVLLGEANDNDVVIRAGINLEDKVLISMPPDPEDLDRELLPEDVIEEYRLEMEREELQRMLEQQEFEASRAARDSLRQATRGQMPQGGQPGGGFPGGMPAEIQEFMLRGGGNFGGGNFGGD